MFARIFIHDLTFMYQIDTFRIVDTKLKKKKWKTRRDLHFTSLFLNAAFSVGIVFDGIYLQKKKDKNKPCLHMHVHLYTHISSYIYIYIYI